LRRPTIAAAVAGLTLLAPIGGCSGDDDNAYEAPTTTTAPPDGPGTTAAISDGRPPEDFDALAALFGPALDGVDLELTRASVSELRKGPHVALYGVPAADADAPQDYLDRLLPSVVAAGKIAFDQFPDVASFDLCQEPTGSPTESPPPITIVVLTREQWESVPDWDDAALADLLRAASLGDGGQVEVPDEIGDLDEWQAAVEEFNESD
jgi:hypothetical protein